MLDNVSCVIELTHVRPRNRAEKKFAEPWGQLSERHRMIVHLSNFVQPAHLMRDTCAITDESEQLRVLLADEKASRLDEIAAIVDALGHTVVARLYNVADVAEASRREQPDVAIVGLGEENLHALQLISELVKRAACPVIADMATDDSAFIDNAAQRGIFAYVKHGSHTELSRALDIVLRRYAEFSRIHGALGRRVIIEQAKGILMERRAISADNAFTSLREHARNTNTTVFKLAEAVVAGHLLFSPSSAQETGAQHISAAAPSPVTATPEDSASPPS